LAITPQAEKQPARGECGPAKCEQRRGSQQVGSAALAADYGHLMVSCEGCRRSAHVPLRGFPRPAETQLIDLAPLLVCDRCGKRGPLPQIKGVTRRST